MDQHVKRLVFVVIVGRRRCDVVVEAAMLVIGDDQERFGPGRAASECMKGLEHKHLATAEVGGGMVVIRTFGAEAEIDEVRIDPRDRRQIALGRTLEEASMTERVLPIEVGRQRLA